MTRQETGDALARRAEAIAESVEQLMRDALTAQLPPKPFLGLAAARDQLELAAARIDLSVGAVTLEGAA